LAWGIARSLADQGAELAFSYQGEALEKRVRPLAAELGSSILIDCDVSSMAALDEAFATLGRQWDGLDFVVHAIGFVIPFIKTLIPNDEAHPVAQVE